MHFKHSLPIDIEKFGFVKREEKNGKPIALRCGRDFLYYALHYYKPDLYAPDAYNPEKIERERIFGVKVPSLLMWTGLQFIHTPTVLTQNKLNLTINENPVENYLDIISALMLPKNIPFSKALDVVENTIESQDVVGIDISLGLCGILDHVLFVYAYDKENLYVFDTYNVQGLEYEKMTPENDERYIMKLPKSVVRKRWSQLLGRVWIVSSNQKGTRERSRHLS